MHSYGKDFKHTAYIHVFLAAISIGAYFIVALIPHPAFVQISPFLTLTIFGLVEFIFDRWAWRLLCLVPFLHVDNFSGMYRGVICAGDVTRHDATFIIKQTWSHIEIDFDSGGASSKSISASVIKDRLKAGQVELVYNYYAQTAKQNGTPLLPAHYGTAMLKLSEDGSKLEGDYFTEQERNSFGTISMERVKSEPR